MNNRLSDTNVGNLDFQPMPKRFMVWDKEAQEFLTYPDDDGYEERVFTPFNIRYVLDEYFERDVVVCQSTNLFDRDGKEIFEGSILEEDLTHLRAGRKYHFIVQYVNAKFTTKPIDGAEFRPAMLPNTTKALRNIGHILSNPELVEGK